MTRWSVFLRLLLALAVAGGAVLLAVYRDRFDPALIEQAIVAIEPWAPLAHVLLFTIATVLFVPGAIVGLVGGVLFGPVWGTLFNLVGATLGATAAFLTARYIASDWVRRKAGGRLQRLITGVEEEGWRFVAFARLVPLFPFNLLNYAFGLTRIRLLHYVIASLVCMFPGTLAYTWLAYAGREALAGHDTAIRYGLIALALLAAIAFAPRIIRRIRSRMPFRWMDAAELSGEIDHLQPTIIDVRGADEFVGPLGHIPGARNVPVGELPRRLHELSAVRDRPIVLVCRTDKRSASAAALLHDAGFRDLRVLRGGMEQWDRHGFNIADRNAPVAA
ncbi:VTT domain-containing protein [Dongia deserti]|uniref:VTT domain-containing protein n=1 Tax=Dongia deserti TaxID=2268030 RepID=UPI000E64E35B|nr:VTT domain-containing protein [Dongia deserti]